MNSIMEEAANINILLVDDDENYLQMTKMYLEDSGMKITTYSSANEALEVCKNKKVDIVLLDYFMPEMTGEEFIKKMREVNKRTLVILQTGFAEKKPPIEMLTTLDIQGYYDKTKDIDELLLLALSSIKTIKLMKINQKQELAIDLLTYKKQFLGNLILGLVNEAKDQIMAISIAKETIAGKGVSCADEIGVITRANQKLTELFDTINFESLEVVKASEMINVLNILLKNIRATEGFTINYDIDAEDLAQIVFSKSIDTMIYVVIEAVYNFISKGIKEITISFKKDEEKFYLRIETPTTYTKDFIKTVALILSGTKDIGIEIKNGKIILSQARGAVTEAGKKGYTIVDRS